MFKEISPLDGRYAKTLAPLGDLFSEFALARERCVVELLYLKALDDVDVFPSLTEEETSRIEEALKGFDAESFSRIKAIEAETNHDVKSCEVYLREALSLRHPERIHFGLTSADINNLAYARLLMRFRDEHQLPQLRELIAALTDVAEAWKSVPFPARTHGQPASPTTAGKEIAVFLRRLLRQAEQLQAHRFHGKLNSATGTYAALDVAASDIDWPSFSKAFIESMGLAWSSCTTQIEGNDHLAEHFALTSRINNIMIDLDRDLWQYISRGEIVQKAVSEEVGSSTMPHKVNPIRFESSEGNLMVSNALLHALADTLTQSRMQRDLSGSTVQRNMGVALSHSFLALHQTLQGLARIDMDAQAARAHVDAAPEVLSEAIQTILRAEGVESPYDLLKSLTRGRAMTLESLHAWVEELPISAEVKARMNALRPSDYVGLAVQICEEAITKARVWLDG